MSQSNKSTQSQSGITQSEIDDSSNSEEQQGSEEGAGPGEGRHQQPKSQQQVPSVDLSDLMLDISSLSQKNLKLESSKSNFQHLKLQSALEISQDSQALTCINQRKQIYGDRAVFLHVYDLDSVTAKLNNVLEGIQSSNQGPYYGLFHVGIEVFGEEWSYRQGGTGETGIDLSYPMSHSEHKYRQSFYLGNSRHDERSFFQLLVELKSKWRGSDYNLFTCNCHTFAQHLCDELEVASIPNFVTSLPDLVIESLGESNFSTNSDLKISDDSKDLDFDQIHNVNVNDDDLDDDILENDKDDVTIQTVTKLNRLSDTNSITMSKHHQYDRSPIQSEVSAIIDQDLANQIPGCVVGPPMARNNSISSKTQSQQQLQSQSKSYSQQQLSTSIQTTVIQSNSEQCGDQLQYEDARCDSSFNNLGLQGFKTVRSGNENLHWPQLINNNVNNKSESVSHSVAFQINNTQTDIDNDIVNSMAESESDNQSNLNQHCLDNYHDNDNTINCNSNSIHHEKHTDVLSLAAADTTIGTGQGSEQEESPSMLSLSAVSTVQGSNTNSINMSLNTSINYFDIQDYRDIKDLLNISNSNSNSNCGTPSFIANSQQSQGQQRQSQTLYDPDPDQLNGLNLPPEDYGIFLRLCNSLNRSSGSSGPASSEPKLPSDSIVSQPDSTQTESRRNSANSMQIESNKRLSARKPIITSIPPEAQVSMIVDLNYPKRLNRRLRIPHYSGHFSTPQRHRIETTIQKKAATPAPSSKPTCKLDSYEAMQYSDFLG